MIEIRYFSCAQAYHHFEDPAHITRALAQHLKPNGRLFIIDFADNESVRKLFDDKCKHDASHTVPHKHGSLLYPTNFVSFYFIRFLIGTNDRYVKSRWFTKSSSSSIVSSNLVDNFLLIFFFRMHLVCQKLK